MKWPDLEALATLSRVAEEHGLHVILIGALARQVVFDAPYSNQAYRATRDIDVVVRVASWQVFDELISALVQIGHFERVSEHRLRYRDGTEIDLLPCGPIADEDGNITWRRSERVVSVAGLSAAEEHSRFRDIGTLRIRVVSLPGLVALKLFAFNDRHVDGGKDLQDLLFILTGATDELQDRVFNELSPELTEMDYAQLGPYLLGRDMSEVLPAHEVRALLGILADRILDGPDYRALVFAEQFGDLDQRIAVFEALRMGLDRAAP